MKQVEFIDPNPPVPYNVEFRLQPGEKLSILLENGQWVSMGAIGFEIRKEKTK